VTGWLLDTNILSELRRPKPERKVLAFIAAHPLEQLYVSVVTFAEIRFGIELVADASKRAELNDWLAHAATALCHGLTILSRDASDYERARAPVVDPWR
jgi:predicted nucleic acid-binding protein